jgi:hypothetical protein
VIVFCHLFLPDLKENGVFAPMFRATQRDVFESRRDESGGACPSSTRARQPRRAIGIGTVCVQLFLPLARPAAGFADELVLDDSSRFGLDQLRFEPLHLDVALRALWRFEIFQ